jgi:hypothetical protein
VKGTSAIEYDEKVLALTAARAVEKTARIYRRADFQRSIGDQPQTTTLRPEIRRLVVMRKELLKVPFSPDGPLTWNEIDLVRTDIFTPALVGLFPTQPVKVGDRWNAAKTAVQDLTDMERIDEGNVECRLEQIARIANRRQARVSFKGAVRGINEDGPNRQQLEGYCYFDLESRHLSYLYLNGTNSLLDKDGKSTGTVEGRFILTRQANTDARDLTPDSWKTTETQPNEDNTLLLYQGPELGLRFLYPRRWRVAGLRGQQVAVDEAQGSGLLITVEAPQTLPTGAQLRTEVKNWLSQQKARTLAENPVRILPWPLVKGENFSLDVELAGQRLVLAYWVIRTGKAGVTLTSRLKFADVGALLPDVERIARSISLEPPSGQTGR